MGNNPGEHKELSKEKIKKISHSHWMFCTRCFLIPSIKPFLLKGDLYVSIYCKCLYDEKEYKSFDEYKNQIMNFKAEENLCKKDETIKKDLFCIYCEKWLSDSCFFSHKEIYPKHLCVKIPLRLREYCHLHEKEPAVGYCNNCKNNFCKLCLQTKLKFRHDIFLHNDKEQINRKEKKFNVFLESRKNFSELNETLKQDMIKIINDNKDILDEEKKIWVNKIINAYDKNKKINDKICEFMLFLFSNFDYSYYICNISNHNIFYNIFDIKFDNTTFSINQDFSPIKNAQKLINYYNSVYIIHLSPLINIKNIYTYRKNVTTKQISKICVLDGNNAATLTSNGIIIVWNYCTYEELYQIKKITMLENTYLEKQYLYFYNNNNDNDDNIRNERLINSQSYILNQIQKNINNNINIEENKKINLIKVLNINNSNKIKRCNSKEEKQNNNNDIVNEKAMNTTNNDIIIEEEDEIDLDYNFSSMEYIKKYKILALIIDNCKDIYLFDIINKKPLIKKLIGHKGEVLSILELKNDNLASYGKDFAIRFWNMKNFQNYMTIKVEIKKYYIYFTQLLYGNIIFATSESCIKVLNMPFFEFNKDITCVSKPMNYFELTDKRLIIACDDYNTKILKPPDYNQVISLFNRRTKIYSFLFLDKNKLLVGLKDNAIHIMYLNKTKSKKNMQSLSTCFSPIGSMVRTNDNKIISISWDNVVKIFLVGDY